MAAAEQPPPPVPAAYRVELVAERPPHTPEPGERRRTGRGHVNSYGLDRVCAAPGCETELSRYNAAPTCWRHRDYRVGFAERWSR
jgi:hypothetical protein